MKKHFQLVAIIACIMLSCNSVSKYIPGKEIKADTSLLGIWKAVEDTNKKDFIIVADSKDMLESFMNNNKRMSDSEKNRSFYKGYYQRVYDEYVTDKRAKNRYFITRRANSGRSSRYSSFSSYISVVNGIHFLSIETPIDSLPYFVMKIEQNKSADTITVFPISDPEFRHASNQKP